MPKILTILIALVLFSSTIYAQGPSNLDGLRKNIEAKFDFYEWTGDEEDGVEFSDIPNQEILEGIIEDDSGDITFWYFRSDADILMHASYEKTLFKDCLSEEELKQFPDTISAYVLATRIENNKEALYDVHVIMYGTYVGHLHVPEEEIMNQQFDCNINQDSLPLDEAGSWEIFNSLSLTYK